MGAAAKSELAEPIVLEPIAPIERDTVKDSNPNALRIVFGQTTMTCRAALDLEHNSVVVLNELADDLLEIYRRDELFAYGRLVMVQDRVCVEVVKRLKTEPSP